MSYKDFRKAVKKAVTETNRKGYRVPKNRQHNSDEAHFKDTSSIKFPKTHGGGHLRIYRTFNGQEWRHQ